MTRPASHHFQRPANCSLSTPLPCDPVANLTTHDYAPSLTPDACGPITPANANIRPLA